MKKIQKIISKSIIVAFLLIIISVLIGGLSLSNCDNASYCEGHMLSTTGEESLATAIITTPYVDNVVEFVYDGTPYQIEANINSGEDILIYRQLGQNEVLVLNEFTEIGEYKIRLTANKNTTYKAPESVYLTVRVLPRTLVSEKSTGNITKVQIINDKGFCLDNSYNAFDVSNKTKREVNRAIKNLISYEQKIDEIINLTPSIDAEKYQDMSVLINLPNNYNQNKNYKLFEYTSDGQVNELSFVVNKNCFAISDINTTSLIVIVADKENPYLWIWILCSCLSVFGIALTCYFVLPRKITFYLDGKKIYIVKLSRKSNFALLDGLEKHDWYLDKNLTIKANSFGVKEKSKKYYSKIRL